jgi:Ulp1 family protease
VPSDLFHAREFLDRNGCKRTFEAKELAILKSPTAWLNDSCVNDGAALLQYILQPAHSQLCAIMSTYVFPMVQKNRSDDDIWRNTYQMCYWRKQVWAVPIHRPNHWVLCLVYPWMHQILFFDSLAARTPWATDIPVVLKLVSRLQSLANDHGHPFDVSMEGWTASPLAVRNCTYPGCLFLRTHCN